LRAVPDDRRRGSVSRQERWLGARHRPEPRRRRRGHGQVVLDHDAQERRLCVHLRPARLDGGHRHPGLEDHQDPPRLVDGAHGSRSQDLARTSFQLLALGALIATIFWILQPFLAALIWAGTIAVATWPLLLRSQAWLGGRRAAAVALLTTVL